MYNLESLFLLGLLLGRAVTFPQLLHFCPHSYSQNGQCVFSYPSIRHNKILLIEQTLAIKLQKGMCTHMLEVRGGDDREGDYGERGARRLLCH